MKDGKPNSFDIAHRAGVSQSTVSRALRNSPVVSKKTRDKIHAIAKELNYKVDVSARNLRSQNSKTLAILLCEDRGIDDSLINPFFVSMLASITRASARHGYDLLMSFQQFHDDWHAQYDDANRADGIIFLGYGDYVSYSRRIHHLEQANSHFITWGPVLAGQPGLFIGCDNVNNAYAMTQHLIDLGRQRIAFIGGTSEHSPEFTQRYQGCVNAQRERGLSVDNALQVDAETCEEQGYHAVKQLLEQQRDFDAVFAASDLIAIGAIRALKNAGRRVPEDVSVVGFDDLPMASYINPPLTTVKQDTIAAGELLVENLLKLIAGDPVESMLLPASLVVRESCGAKLL